MSDYLSYISSNIVTEHTRTRMFLYMPYIAIYREDVFKGLFAETKGSPCLNRTLLNAFAYYKNRGLNRSEIVLVFTNLYENRLLEVARKCDLNYEKVEDYILVYLPIREEVVKNFLAGRYSRMYRETQMILHARKFEQNHGGIPKLFGSTSYNLTLAWHILAHSVELKNLLAKEFGIEPSKLDNREFLGSIEPENETLHE